MFGSKSLKDSGSKSRIAHCGCRHQNQIFLCWWKKFCFQDDAGHGPLQPPEGTLQQDEHLSDALHCQAGEQQPLPLPGNIHMYCTVLCFNRTVLYCAVLCCAVLYCTVMHCTVQCCGSSLRVVDPDPVGSASFAGSSIITVIISLRLQVSVNQWETCGNWEVGKEKTRALEYTNDGQVKMLHKQCCMNQITLSVRSPMQENLALTLKKYLNFKKKYYSFVNYFFTMMCSFSASELNR